MSDKAKRNAATAAVALVEDGMRLGIGTGSTAEQFIRLLAERTGAGLSVIGVPTSERTADLCRDLGIPLTDLEATPSLDLAVDGADEFDPGLHLIKGGGGALLREKIVAAAAERFVVIADASKRVPMLGAFALPVEIIPMACRPLSRRIADLGAEVVLRQGADGEAFRSDEGHWILDCAFGPTITDPPALATTLSALAGVVDHGLFCGMTERVLVGADDGVEEVVAG
ncbi:MAG: ribose-5-phosphate isomerase RpiA [Alphaproteobacteria bacterium]|jgi:ribose 5-phosphate isomerase A|nr:ribose-5-phosphate isomerase RpiA [Alphaproteobacteria bacterium]MDP6566943.1 ribose-5-phosphate isomerase RpiA [Alphaproteobacteria bacterium]MDP6813743.1 ribose-5-phosphate isomerase RpiA [Alphaproteobacteria bacterium]